MDSGAPCPCGRSQGSGARKSPLPYGQCCGRYHTGPLALQAPDAEHLMRSRYSAFVLDLRDYLLATWHPDHRPSELDPPEPGLRWLGMEVRAHRLLDADHAEVRFVARSKLGGRAHRLAECSRFERLANGRWVYVDGQFE